MTGKEYMERVMNAERKMNAEIRKAEIFRSLAERVTAAFGGEVVSHSRNVSANEDAIIRVTEVRDRVIELTREYQEIVAETIETLRSVRDRDGETILSSYYIDHVPFSKISKQMHLGRTQVHEHYVAALHELDEMLAKSPNVSERNRTCPNTSEQNRA